MFTQAVESIWPSAEVWQTVLEAVIAGLLASVACGLGALPLLIKKFDVKERAGLGYAIAGGLMISASLFNLILPGLQMDGTPANPGEYHIDGVLPVLLGFGLGCLFLTISHHWVEKWTSGEKLLDGWGGRAGVLIFIAMSVHSIPEGVAVGVGYQGEQALEWEGLGNYLAIAIAIHNIPEGLAVAIPLRASGLSMPKCFLAGFLTSLPQPIAAVPAIIASWFFEPLMPVLMGFAAGAMIFLVVLEMLPDAFEKEGHLKVAWAFVLGFAGMFLLQVLL